MDMLDDVRMTAVLPVRDLARARTFWEKMVGLAPNRVEEDGKAVMYLRNNTALFVYETEHARVGGVKAIFVVDDLEREMADLTAHGIDFAEFDEPDLRTVGGIAERAGRRTAWFKDLEGNYIGVTQLM
jgi:extradiol dioxygenase family protein